MYKISKVLPFNEKIEIVPFGDIHKGNENCNFNKFKETVNYIRDTPNCYGIGMGDYLECILHTDKRFSPNKSVYESVDKQVKDFTKVLEPIKDKILVLLTGNHEYKFHTAGFGDPTMRMCAELGVEYGGYSCFLKLKMPEHIHRRGLVIYCHHGWSAGRKTGATINNIEGLAQHWMADVYLVGHSHKLCATRQIKIGWEGERKMIFGSTGTFLETVGDQTTGYSEKAGFPPLKIGVLNVQWFPVKEDVHVSE